MPVMELELAIVAQRRAFLAYDRAIHERLPDDEIAILADKMVEASRDVKLARTAKKSAERELLILAVKFRIGEGLGDA